MGDTWIPEDILEMKPLIRNFFENTSTVQVLPILIYCWKIKDCSTFVSSHVFFGLPFIFSSRVEKFELNEVFTNHKYFF
jgi:hypothetical protein